MMSKSKYQKTLAQRRAEKIRNLVRGFESVQMQSYAEAVQNGIGKTTARRLAQHNALQRLAVHMGLCRNREEFNRVAGLYNTRLVP